jgi:benzylsuccinate CoA-transferase BbsE subunit
LSGPLHHLRVIDLTDDAGRFSTKLLTELGADVLRVIDRGSRGRDMRDHDLNALGGVLDWWYDGGKRRHIIDLDSTDGRDRYRQLAARADLVIESMAAGRLAELGVDHDRLVKENPHLVQVSITPFGRTGPRASWVTSDLVSAAMGGFLSVTGLPDRPLNVWGRQAYNYAGFLAAIAALAGVRTARLGGGGAHVDVSIHECLAGSVENTLMQWFFDDLLPIPKVAARQGALHWLRAYDLAACKSGYTMITPTPGMISLIEWLLEDGITEAAEWLEPDPDNMVGLIDRIMDTVRGWVAQYDASDLWWAAQQRHIAFGAVHNIEEVAAISQYEHRRFFRVVQGTDDRVRTPAHMVRFSGTPLEAPRPPAGAESGLDDLVRYWHERDRSRPSAVAPDRRPRAGL